MRILMSLVCVMMSFGLVWGADTHAGSEAEKLNTLTDQERQEGWTLLWNGRTGDGWRARNGKSFPKTGWEIADGVLSVLPKKAGGGAGDIVTCETYANFILKLEFRLTDVANSGIKYFFDPALHGGTALEYQLLDPKHSDANKGLDGNRKVASLYDVLPAVGAKANPVGEWNSVMIMSLNNQVTHWLNGEKVLSFTRGSSAFRDAVAKSKFMSYPNWGEQASGHILLQDHNDRVSFRNIKIKVLP